MLQLLLLTTKTNNDSSPACQSQVQDKVLSPRLTGVSPRFTVGYGVVLTGIASGFLARRFLYRCASLYAMGFAQTRADTC